MADIYTLEGDEFLFTPSTIKNGIENITESENKSGGIQDDISDIFKSSAIDYAKNKDSFDLSKLYPFKTEENDESDIKLPFDTDHSTEKKYPFDLSLTNSLRINRKIVQIDNNVISIEDIIGLRWYESLSNLHYCDYTFELKTLNTEYRFNCRVIDGDDDYTINSDEFRVDIFSAAWLIVLNILKEYTGSFLLQHITESINKYGNYDFGYIYKPKDIEDFISLSISNNGINLNFKTIITKNDVLIPWHQISYNIKEKSIVLSHDLNSSDRIDLQFSDWNVFLFADLIDYYTNS